MQGGDTVAYDSPAGSATAAGQCSGSCLRLCGVGDLLLLRPGFSAERSVPETCSSGAERQSCSVVMRNRRTGLLPVLGRSACMRV